MTATRWICGMLASVLGSLVLGVNTVDAESQPAKSNQSGLLSERDVALIKVSALTSFGNTEKLDSELRLGLEAGLTVSQLRAALEQLYAYCGFPRSLNGISALMKVVDDRRRQGIHDELGKKHEPIVDGDRYERGRLTLEKLTGVPQAKPAPGFGEFSTEIDRFLKEHLFADIFDNQILTSRERELVTIAALSSMSGVESQLKSHVGIGKNTGITDSQLNELASLVEETVGRRQANQLRQFLGQKAQGSLASDALVRISEIEVSPESQSDYLQILKEEARKSVEAESGVIGIFPMTRKDDPTKVRIVEVYTDQAAYEAHIASPHFKHYKTATLQMVKSLQIVELNAVDPETMHKIFEKQN